MTEVLVWVLIMASWDGGVVQIPNIRSWEDCERLRIRSEAIITPNGRNTLRGTCTQVGLLVPTATLAEPKPAVINVLPAPVPAVKNVVVVKEKK